MSFEGLSPTNILIIGVVEMVKICLVVVCASDVKVPALLTTLMWTVEKVFTSVVKFGFIVKVRVK